MLNITVSKVGDVKVHRMLNAISRLPHSNHITRAMGGGARKVVKEHLYEKDAQPNKMGAKKTHYYRQAGDAVTYRSKKGGVVVTIEQVGIRQRWLGGTITPKKSKYLTIPVSSKSRSKRAREFSGLVYVKRRGTAGILGLPDGEKIDALYVLKKSVTQRPDPTVLPKQREIESGASKAIDALVKSILKGRLV